MRLKSIIQKPLSYAYHNITLYLIVLNIIVFAITSVIPRSAIYVAMNPLLVNGGYVWTFLSYMFVHGDVGHIFFNMLALFMFGTQVEQEMGSWEFLLFYLITGGLAGVLSYFIYLLSGLYLVSLIGASGAVYGVMLAFATYFPNARIFLFGLIPVRSVHLVVLFTVIAIFNQLSGSRGSVAHMTHLGGLLFALIYLLLRIGINPIKKWTGR